MSYLILHKIRQAYTMIELVFVIVILGIVGSIGSSIIAQVYENYIIQRATHSASIKTEIAAQQIANLLSYRIPGTTLARNPLDMTDNILVTDATNDSDYIHIVLEWIGTDHDGFSAKLLPPWNGFCDVMASTQTNIITPGSKLSDANTTMSNLSGTEVSLLGPQYPAIFFRNLKYAHNSTAGTDKFYDVLTCMGMTPSSDTSCISKVGNSGDENLTFQGNSSTTTDKVISEHYKLAWTAYAIRPVANSHGGHDLRLYYNYQPWEGDTITTTVWPSHYATLVTDVTVFKFAESGSTFRFKLCAQENIGGEYNVTICKEKAVIL